MNKSVKKWTLPKLKTLSQRKSHLKVKHKDECSGGFPGDSVVESACQCSRHRLDPWSRKIPHATEQLSPCAITTEPVF